MLAVQIGCYQFTQYEFLAVVNIKYKIINLV